MANQTGKNILVSYKAETTIGVAATGTGGKTFRTNAGSGLQMTRATIDPNEVRADGKTAMGRLGSKSVAGTLPADMSLQTFDDLFQAGVRGTWDVTLSVTQATSSLTSVTSDATSFVAADGSFLSAGFRVGDVFVATGLAATTNNSRDLRVTAVTTLTLSVAETLTVDAVADTSFLFSRGRKLTMPTTPVRRSFTFDEYLADLDLSKVSVGCRVASFKITGQPDGMAMVEFGVVGMDQTTQATGASPTLTSPTLTSTIALTWLDATIRVAGSDRTNLTGFEFTFDNGAAGLPVIGSLVSPDVFENNAKISGSFSSTVQDFTDFDGFIAETEFEFHALLVEPESEPKDYISIFMPRLKRTSYDTPLGADGAMIATANFMSGTKGTATGYDDTMISIVTSAAA